MSARVEEKAGHLIKARSLLEKARQCNPGTAELWLEAVRVENRAGLASVAHSLMAKGNSCLIVVVVVCCNPSIRLLSRTESSMQRFSYSQVGFAVGNESNA